jgi:hypothetical protein
MLGLLLYRRSDLSNGNEVLLYKELIRPVMDYGGSLLAPISGASIQVSSHCSSAPGYICNSQIHDDFGVPYFTDYIRSLTERFESKLAILGISGLRSSADICRPSVDSSPLKEGDQNRQLVLAKGKAAMLSH